jgi:hypothetical protein
VTDPNLEQLQLRRLEKLDRELNANVALCRSALREGRQLDPDERERVETTLLAFEYELREMARRERWPIPPELLEHP